jgi:ribosomal protein S18 acetylase RimI-like enzyme
MNTPSNIQIRPASIADRGFILSLLPRLLEFGPPSWRDPAQMIATDMEVVSDKLITQPAGTAFFIAEDKQGVALGFIHLQTGTDYYQHAEHGHIANLIVTSEGEGQGIGRMLLEKGEEWARWKGYHWLTLSVFAQNQRARNLYSKLGYGEDILKYVKELD